MASKGVSLLKFVGTVSLGLLTGVSYTVSNFTLPALLSVQSSASASASLESLVSSLKTPTLALTSLASAPFLLCFAFSGRPARHPYLIYTALLAILSTTVPQFLPQPVPRTAVPKPRSSHSRMEASYEVLDNANSDDASEEEIDDVDSEGVRAKVESLARGYLVQTGLAALGFAMAVVGIWGDGAPKAAVYVS